MKTPMEKEIQKEAQRIKEEYAYMDGMPLDGWFWEIIRRNHEYRDLAARLNALSGPVSEEESRAIDDRLDDIGIMWQLYHEGEPWVSLPDYLWEEPPSINRDFPEEPILRLIHRGGEVIPRPDFSYQAIYRYIKERYGFEPLPLVKGTRPHCEVVLASDLCSQIEHVASVTNKNTHSIERRRIEAFVALVRPFVTGMGVDDTILIRINRNVKFQEIEKILIPELRKRLRSPRPRLRVNDKWKFYLMAYDLKERHPLWGNEELADILNEAFPPSKSYKALDSRTVGNHYKGALALINGEYKRYLHKIT